MIDDALRLNEQNLIILERTYAKFMDMARMGKIDSETIIDLSDYLNQVVHDTMGVEVQDPNGDPEPNGDDEDPMEVFQFDGPGVYAGDGQYLDIPDFIESLFIGFMIKRNYQPLMDEDASSDDD